MSKNIPIYFDEAIILNSPIQEIASTNDSTISRLKVGAFYKYKNRNGSYITDEYADYLIKSATRGNVPVVGFFDPSEQTWASHTGPTLANGYGYIESFLGWEPFTDTDGETREYAVFSVILFTDYFNEACKVLGQHQSMELDPATIDGDWARFGDEEYFVYTTGQMASFCIIGAHEPCFSVSSFFSKNDDIYNTQLEKFSSLLSHLKTVVEEAEKNKEGGEQPMNDFENQELETQVVDPQTEETVAPETFEETPAVEDTIEETPAVEDTFEVVEEAQVEETPAEPSEFETLQTQFNELQESYNQLQENLNTAQSRIEELEAFQASANTELENLRSTNAELQTSLQAYQAEATAAENARKNGLVEKYEKLLTEEEISPIKTAINDFSYDELESKLAITFANKQMTGGEVKKVPLPDPEEKTQFALFMEKYRKN